MYQHYSASLRLLCHTHTPDLHSHMPIVFVLSFCKSQIVLLANMMHKLFVVKNESQQKLNDVSSVYMHLTLTNKYL